MLCIPQKEVDMDFGLTEIEKGLADDSRLWEEVSRKEMENLEGRKGYRMSSSFVHWEGVDEDGNKKKECWSKSSSLRSRGEMEEVLE